MVFGLSGQELLEIGFFRLNRLRGRGHRPNEYDKDNLPREKTPSNFWLRNYKVQVKSVLKTKIKMYMRLLHKPKCDQYDVHIAGIKCCM
jgi:hypothetical protein